MSPPAYGESTDTKPALLRDDEASCSNGSAVAEESPVECQQATDNGNSVSKRSHVLLVQDFLLPCLDDGCYGSNLVWVDRSKGIFRINWRHQGSKSFTLQQGAFFKDWVDIKSGWQDDDPLAMTKAKQRMRAAFLKSCHLKLVFSSRLCRVYRIRHFKKMLRYVRKRKSTDRRKKQPYCPRDRRKKQPYCPRDKYKTILSLPIVHPLGSTAPHEVFLSTGEAWLLDEELCESRLLIKCVCQGGVSKAFFDQL